MMIDWNIFNGFYKVERLPRSVVAYHITRRGNLHSVMAGGLLSAPCVATANGADRAPAVYLFASRSDAYDQNIRCFLFGKEDGLVVLRIEIPQSHFQHLAEDGLFNASVECCDGSWPTAMKFTADIPAEWIKESK